jgi:hypothetical protein
LAAPAQTVFDTMPQMQRRVRPKELSGLVLADVLYMPEGITVHGMTVVIANHIVYEGRSIYIRCDGNAGTEMHFWQGWESRALPISLERALRKNGLDPKSFPDGLPPFSVIKDLDLPKTPLRRIEFNCPSGGRPFDAPEFGGPIMTTPH